MTLGVPEWTRAMSLLGASRANFAFNPNLVMAKFPVRRSMLGPNLPIGQEHGPPEP
jgi:hypothetical protein